MLFKNVIFVGVFLLTIITSNATFTVHKEESVFVLDEQIFDQAVQLDQKWFIMFYSPRCGDCSTKLPILNDFARMSENLMVGKVDIEQNKSFFRRYDIDNVPFFAYVEMGLLYPYNSEVHSVDSWGRFVVSGYKKVEHKYLYVPAVDEL